MNKDNILEEKTTDLTIFFKKIYFDWCFGNWIYEADLDILESLSKLEYDDYKNLYLLGKNPIEPEVFNTRIKLINEEIERKKRGE